MRRLFDKYPVEAVLLLMLLCLSPFMALRDLTPANELRYLSITDEALRDGHLFAFFNHGVPYADKPPLYFWLLMLCKKLFGRHCLYLLSLFSFLPAAVVTCVMDRWVFRGQSDATPRNRAAMALLLGSTVYWLALSIFLRMDMLMTMFIVLALYAWHRDKPWLFALYTFLALFTKGPVGILMPPLVVLVCILSYGRKRPDQPQYRLGRFLGWRFLLLVGGCCAVWFTCARLEGGADYLRNLLFHQTVDRTIHATHHQEPFWFYLVQIWPYLVPWCLLTLPVCVASLCHKGGDPVERLFRCAFFVPLVMLSCASGKLPVYLLPVFPFVTYLLPVYVRRTGWKRWMDATVGAAGVLFALIGIGLALVPLFAEKIPALAKYGFATSPFISLTGCVLACGGLLTAVRAFRHGRELAATTPLALAIPALFLALAPLLPEGNEFLGYRSLCRDVPAGEKVYVLGLSRPENMDVYLGRAVTILEPDDPVPADGVLITRHPITDPALKGRESHIHGESTLWLPRPANPLQ